MLSQMKQDWIQFPLISDKCAVAKLQTLKARYDGVSLRRGDDDPLFDEELSELSISPLLIMKILSWET